MSLIWVDVNGLNRFHQLQTSAGASAVVTALLGKSHGDVLVAWEGPLYVNGSPVVTTGDYQSVSDYAELLFQTAVGTQVNVAIPAPDSAIFLADGFTVDSTQIAGIIAAVIANCVDGNGNAVTTYLGGVRQKS